MEWKRRRSAVRRARELRRDSTDAEQELWARLREVRLAKFRRQHPLAGFVVDFVCLDSKLVVEVDGGQHATAARDPDRTRRLEALGFEVLRFWNNDVLSNPDGVITRIAEALSRLREREGTRAAGRVRAAAEGGGMPAPQDPRLRRGPSPRPSPVNGRGRTQ